jgi:hypothetical protein
MRRRNPTGSDLFDRIRKAALATGEMRLASWMTRNRAALVSMIQAALDEKAALAATGSSKVPLSPRMAETLLSVDGWIPSVRGNVPVLYSPDWSEWRPLSQESQAAAHEMMGILGLESYYRAAQDVRPKERDLLFVVADELGLPENTPAPAVREAWALALQQQGKTNSAELLHRVEEGFKALATGSGLEDAREEITRVFKTADYYESGDLARAVQTLAVGLKQELEIAQTTPAVGAGLPPAPSVIEEQGLAGISALTDPRTRTVKTVMGGGGIPITSIIMDGSTASFVPEKVELASVQDAEDLLNWMVEQRTLAEELGMSSPGTYEKTTIRIDYGDGAIWRARFDVNSSMGFVSDLFDPEQAGGGVTWANTTRNRSLYSRDTVLPGVPDWRRAASTWLEESPLSREAQATRRGLLDAGIKNSSVYVLERAFMPDDTERPRTYVQVLHVYPNGAVKLYTRRADTREVKESRRPWSVHLREFLSGAKPYMITDGYGQYRQEREIAGSPDSTGLGSIADSRTTGLKAVRAVLQAAIPGVKFYARGGRGTGYSYVDVGVAQGQQLTQKQQVLVQSLMKAMNLRGGSAKWSSIFIPQHYVALADAAAKGEKGLVRARTASTRLWSAKDVANFTPELSDQLTDIGAELVEAYDDVVGAVAAFKQHGGADGVRTLLEGHLELLRDKMAEAGDAGVSIPVGIRQEEKRAQQLLDAKPGPKKAAAQAAKTVSPAPATGQVVVTATPEEGVTITGSTYPFKDVIKGVKFTSEPQFGKQAFRWSRAAQLWYIRGSKGKPTSARDAQAARAALVALQQAGADVSVTPGSDPYLMDVEDDVSKYEEVLTTATKNLPLSWDTDILADTFTASTTAPNGTYIEAIFYDAPAVLKGTKPTGEVSVQLFESGDAENPFEALPWVWMWEQGDGIRRILKAAAQQAEIKG